MNKYGYANMSKLANFGPVYLINLPDQTKRLHNIKKEFMKYGVTNYKVIEAVDGRKDDLRGIVHGAYPKLRPAEIGCLASHITAIKTWLEDSTEEYGIIMEDDCTFDTVQYWQWDWDYFMENMPKDADIIQLVMIKENNVKFHMHEKEKYNRKDVYPYAWSTACYIIKRSYAKNIVNTFLIDGKYEFAAGKYKDKPADVLLYNLGTAYSMPIFTHFVDTKNAINLDHQSFHKRSKNNIDSWWERNAKKYPKESFFDVKNGLQRKKQGNVDLVFNIFHVDGDTDSLKKRSILVQRATDKLLDNFDKIETPTIIIKNEEDVKNFFNGEDIKIDPLGWEKRGWRFGELGIWASNYSAWKKFAKSGREMLMLMEDDIVLDKEFNQKLSGYISELPDDWDFFTVYIPSYGNSRAKTQKKLLDVGKQNITKVYQSWSCLCYIVSKSGVEKLLKQVQEPVNGPIDHWLFYNEKLNGYSIKYGLNNICDIYDMDSTIQSGEYIDMSHIFNQ